MENLVAGATADFPPNYRKRESLSILPVNSKRVKAMTIAVGFHCDDGIVIAADRQFTSQGFFKYHEEKFAFEDKGDLSTRIIFVFSGDPGLFKEAHQKIMGFLRLAELPTVDLVQQTVEGVLTSMGWKEHFLDNSLFMLVGVVEPFENPVLLVFNNRSLHQAGKGVQTIGCGDTSLIRYLGDHLYQESLKRSEGIALAAYLIKKATQYVDYCGEPIDVFCLDDYSGVVTVSQEEIKAAVQKMESQESQMYDLLIQKPFSSPTEP
ncbi:hypothetical protein H7849_18045 [Alloacidobacterium dinghuense]|uniref:Uncharacterized protein n=1 Tax=Alloacidobacterium dinghuense TaxID=2763107 RepID=A0A7G8BEM9_9BACT|nr:hypothetical protein [Alloacidobacterium dinghuense]QNI30999.1 hypothetical protein H7849_18045 [Alloacidobacterium dinghuense]